MLTSSCFDKLSMNGSALMISRYPPLTLSPSKGERRVFQQPARGAPGAAGDGAE
jgi:hypothetical protein